MAAKLRQKPGGDEIGVTIGDFATATVEGVFSVAYLIFNSIFNLTRKQRRSRASACGGVLRDHAVTLWRLVRPERRTPSGKR
jgi:hypothetical protein